MMMQPCQCHAGRRGFSLVELAVVMTILGLITGGILGGQALVRAAQIKQLTTEIDKYRTAIIAFRDDYQQLPGDMPNAVALWGVAPGATSTADGYDATCAGIATMSTTQATCNGNGDGLIAPASGNTYTYERYRAWQHLSNAGLISGMYSGVNSYTTANPNVPKARLGGGTTFNVYYYPPSTVFSASANFFANSYGNLLSVGANVTGVSNSLAPVLTPEEAWRIDMKLDDGLAGAGGVMTPYGGGTLNPGCTAATGSLSDSYAIGSSGNLCALMILLKI